MSHSYLLRLDFPSNIEDVKWLLALLDYAVWYLKIVGQRGLHIVSLDDSGTHSITEIRSMHSIVVKAFRDVDVCHHLIFGRIETRVKYDDEKAIRQSY